MSATYEIVQFVADYFPEGRVEASYPSGAFWEDFSLCISLSGKCGAEIKDCVEEIPESEVNPLKIGIFSTPTQKDAIIWHRVKEPIIALEIVGTAGVSNDEFSGGVGWEQKSGDFNTWLEGYEDWFLEIVLPKFDALLNPKMDQFGRINKPKKDTVLTINFPTLWSFDSYYDSGPDGDDYDYEIMMIGEITKDDLKSLSKLVTERSKSNV